MSARRSIAAAVLALLVCAQAASAQRVDTVPLAPGGTTKLRLARATAAALDQAGVRVSGQRGLSFRIAGGSIDPVDATPAVIRHSGRLTFRRVTFERVGRRRRRVTRTLSFGRLRLTLGRRPALTAKLGAQTLTIATLDTTRARIARQGVTSTDVSRIAVRLTGVAAARLNAALEVVTFGAGLTLATATADTRLAEALVDGGSNTLQLDQQTAADFARAGISSSAIAPATQPSRLTFEFPITGGRLDLASLATVPRGQIVHSGGIRFENPSTGGELPLRRLIAVLDPTPTFSSRLGAGRVDAADLDLSGLATSVRGKRVELAGAVVKVNEASAAVFQQQFGVSVPPGTVIGRSSARLTLK